MVLAFLGEILAIAGYAMLFAAVYKLSQIGTELSEIKELLKAQRRNQEIVAPAVSAHDGADDYALNLLRAVNAEAHPAQSGTREAV